MLVFTFVSLQLETTLQCILDVLYHCSVYTHTFLYIYYTCSLLYMFCLITCISVDIQGVYIAQYANYIQFTLLMYWRINLNIYNSSTTRRI